MFRLGWYVLNTKIEECINFCYLSKSSGGNWPKEIGARGTLVRDFLGQESVATEQELGGTTHEIPVQA